MDRRAPLIQFRRLSTLRALFFWLLLLVVGAGIYFYANQRAADPLEGLPRGARYLAGYGPNRYSQFAEEWIIRDFFKDRRGGTFVDVGANHYKQDSTTFYLEEHLGWFSPVERGVLRRRGLLVE